MSILQDFSFTFPARFLIFRQFLISCASFKGFLPHIDYQSQQSDNIQNRGNRLREIGENRIDNRQTDDEQKAQPQQRCHGNFFKFSFFLFFLSHLYPPKTISSFGALVISSHPFSLSISTSSILTPNLPGMYIPGSALMTAPTGIIVSHIGEAEGLSWI